MNIPQIRPTMTGDSINDILFTEYKNIHEIYKLKREKLYDTIDNKKLDLILKEDKKVRQKFLGMYEDGHRLLFNHHG